MKFRDILSAYENGDKIRRSCWGMGIYIGNSGNTLNRLLDEDDLNANDWEVMQSDIQYMTQIDRYLRDIRLHANLGLDVHYTPEGIKQLDACRSWIAHKLEKARADA